MIRVANRLVIALTNADVDDLAGETLWIRHCFSRRAPAAGPFEADEIRALPAGSFVAAIAAFAALALGLVVLWAIRKAQFAVGDRLTAMSEQQLAKSGLADVESGPLIASPRFPARPAVHHRRRARVARHLLGY